FAVLQHFADGSLTVAVVAKEKMQQWLRQLQTWQVQADVLLPVSLALPFEESCWSILVNEVVTFRTHAYQGFAGDITNFSMLLTTALNEMPPPQRLHFYYCTEQAVLSYSPVLPVTEEIIHPEKMLTLFASHEINVTHPNLLQADYAVKRARFPQMKKMGKIAASLAIAWLILLFLYPIVSYFILNQRLHHLEMATREIYQQQFPRASSMIAPRLRLEEKLQKLMTENGSNRFLVLLAQVGKSLNLSSGISLKRLDFQNNQLSLTLSAASSEEFAALTASLSQQGLTVKQQSANLIGAQMSASLIVE
ncbi:MAG: hypothetical protein JO149_06245, partial [Gammaproteobacteria bacterium]|nr:hypothetical protein [Gammaproteobacteria bacterium]